MFPIIVTPQNATTRSNKTLWFVAVSMLVTMVFALLPASSAFAQEAKPLPSDHPSLRGLQTEHRVGQYGKGAAPSTGNESVNRKADWQGAANQNTGGAAPDNPVALRDKLDKPELTSKEQFIDQQPEVRSAKSRLETAEQNLNQTVETLTELAHQYEISRAAVEELAHTLDLAPEAIAKAAKRVVAARESKRNLIRDSYKSVGLYTGISVPSTLAGATLQDNLHARGALHQAITSNHKQVQRAELVADLEIESFEIANTSASGALAELRTMAINEQRLNEKLEEAAKEIEAARLNLTNAIQTASKNHDKIVDMHARMEAERLAAEGGQIYVEGLLDADYTHWRLATINGKKQVMTCPVGNPVSFIDSWGFPRSGGRTHKGVDMMAPRHTPLYAVADGYIQRVYNNNLGGLSINLIDSLGHKYYYAHLQAAFVKNGQVVKVGQHIGSVGNSGNARGTPPHNHWQFHPNAGPPVNPTPLATALCK